MSLTLDAFQTLRSGLPVSAPVSLTLAPGKGAALRGANGAGKSTLLRGLIGLAPARGQAVLNGVSSDEPDRWLDQIAHTAHSDAIKGAFTVRENLAFWASLYGGDPAHAMERFDLTTLADRPAAACSAGQKRRLGLARLVLSHRPLWLLDEPTVSLDTAHTALFADALKTHLQAGGMALIATHIDLGLPLPPLEITPPAPESRNEDPFLKGDWA